MTVTETVVTLRNIIKVVWLSLKL